ncbi:MAG: flagellar hook-basal body complex protein FliE [Myxococcota bacterium]|jgi:flagellar hook-basal body complex protein FliE
MNVMAALQSMSPQMQGVSAPGLESGLKVGDQNKTDNALFEQALGRLEQVDESQATANSLLADLAAGKNVDLHETFIALEQADIELRTMVSVRNRVVSAYEQVMNMAL